MQTEPILSPHDGSTVGHIPVCGAAGIAMEGMSHIRHPGIEHG